MVKVRTKICGITNSEDGLMAVQLGAWALGFVFYKKSSRYVNPVAALSLMEKIPSSVERVGVFVNEEESVVRKTAETCGLSMVQLHGDETPGYCERLKDLHVIKAFSIREDFDFQKIADYPVDEFLFDAYHENAYGGSGKTFNWDLLKSRKFAKPIILSGGLNPGNVVQAIETVWPYAVDVSSGVEEWPGKKSEKILKDFFEKVNQNA